MTTGEVLLACPFCGGEASDAGHTRYSRPLDGAEWADGTPIIETFHVNCIKCGATSRSGLCNGYQNRAEAVTAWNTRSLPQTDGRGER